MEDMVMDSLADLFVISDGWSWGDPSRSDAVPILRDGLHLRDEFWPWRDIVRLTIQTFRGGPRPSPLVRAAQADLFGLGVGHSAVLKTTGQSVMVISTRWKDAKRLAPTPDRKFTLAEAIAAETLAELVGQEQRLPAHHDQVHAELGAVAAAFRSRPWGVKREVQRLSKQWNWPASPRTHETG
jgi:hypothetical protein